MKFYLFARHIEGDTVREEFNKLDELEEFLLNAMNELEDIKIIEGAEMDFELKVKWK